MIALIEAYRAGLYTRANLWRNALAGAIVGVVALPLSMAFAIASGAKPEQGLYTAIVAGLIASLFGGTRAQISGPTGAFIVILASITAKYGIDGLQLATFMAGVILLIFGFTKMGALIKFIPDPVIAGFTAGIGVIIFVGQWVEFFGTPLAHGDHFHQKLISTVSQISSTHLPTLIIGMLSLALVIYTPKIPYLRKLPGPLVALIGGTLIAVLLHPEGVRTIGSKFGALPQTLPALTLPHFSLSHMIELSGSAFTIAMLCAIESLLAAVVADGMGNTRHDSNQELIGQGLANLIAPLLGGFAATGAIARTATNIRNGGNMPLAGVMHALVLLAIILLFAPLAVHIPMATLSAILFVVAWNMSDFRHCLQMVQRAPRADVAILIITFLLTVFTDLVVAVNIGVILATLHFLRRMSASLEVRAHSDSDLANDLSKSGMEKLPEGVAVYSMDGPVFFGAVDQFERALLHTASDPRLLILHLRWVPFIDITGLQTLEQIIGNFHRRGVRLILCGANARVYGKLERAGILAQIDNRYYATLSEALSGINH